jgi:hypothetical protein
MKNTKSTFLLILILVASLTFLLAQKSTKIRSKSKNKSNTAAPAKVPVSLFDGKTLNGWNQIPANSWVVKDSVMASLGMGRGVIYTTKEYENYRLIFTVRHISGKPDHKAAVLFFCTAPLEGEKTADALAGIQFQVPTGSHWDYRLGHNNSGDGFVPFPRGQADFHECSRIELLVDAKTGSARVAVSQPIGSKAIEVGTFKDLAAAKKGPIAFQMHNGGLFDEYKDINIEVDPEINDLITTK